jgi:hypothetical protein
MMMGPEMYDRGRIGFGLVAGVHAAFGEPGGRASADGIVFIPWSASG